MSTINHTETSPTAAVCENLQLFGGAPELGETDTRVIWDEDEALAGIQQVVHILAQSVAPDGTQLADERESLLWGFVNTLHAQTQRIDRAVDKIVPEMRDLERAQDGSEVSAHELETLTGRAQKLGDRRMRSRRCATSPPKATASRPERPGVRVRVRTRAAPVY